MAQNFQKSPPPKRDSAEQAYKDFTAIYEETQSTIQGLGEGIQALDEKMDRVENELKREIQGLDARLVRVEAIASNLPDDVGHIRRRVTATEKDTGEIKKEVKAIRKELHNAPSAREHAKLEQRVSALEQKLER